MTMENEIMKTGGEIVLYQPDETLTLEVQLQEDTVWLSQQQMARLFATTKQNVSLHIGNIFREGELRREVVVKDFFTTTPHGAIPGKVQHKKLTLYNLDVIISVGYRVMSQVGVRFRQWALAIIKDYMLRGYTVNRHLIALQERTDERFRQIEQRLDDQQQKVEFLVKAHTIPQENLFATGCVWDAYAYVCDLVRCAKGRIVLIDNFVDDRVLKILDKRSDGVTATVHTRYTEQFELDLAKHNEQCAPIERVQLPMHIHDRFLIVDDDVYLLGASVKDMGKGLCAITKVGFPAEQVLGLVK